MRVNPWTYIILGGFLLGVGAIIHAYGWYKLKFDVPKTHPLSSQTTNIGQITGGVVHTGKGDISITNYQGFPEDRIRKMFKEELKKLLPHDPDTMRLKTQAENAITEGKLDEAARLIKNVKLRTQREFLDHLHNSLASLETNITNFNNGDQTAWFAITLQLYILLCDNSRGPVLIERIIPNFSLHPLLIDMSGKEKDYLMFAPGVKVSPEGIRLVLFDFNKPIIPLDLWLKQTIMIMNVGEKGIPITIGGLIREVYDQEVRVHPEIGETVQAASGGKFFEKGIQTPQHVKFIVAIAEYVVPEINKQLGNSLRKQ